MEEAGEPAEGCELRKQTVSRKLTGEGSTEKSQWSRGVTRRRTRGETIDQQEPLRVGQ